MPAKKLKRKPPKAKQNPVHGNAFIEIADQLRAHARNELVDTNSFSALLLLIADVFRNQGKKVQ